MSEANKLHIGIIGLGYVGLPLAIEFAKQYSVLGFDIDEARVAALESGEDRTKEADIEQLQQVLNKTGGLKLSADPADLADVNVYIVTVPTPVDQFKAPDLKPLLAASQLLAGYLSKGDIVIYESTVYPGCTEEDCVPVLAQYSGLKYNEDFYCGYSPERINPGDKVNTLTKIIKVTSGSTPEIAEKIDALYASIISAGTHKAPSIKVAEASKAIENAQRDLNISFVNELALIFDKLNIDTSDVIAAAGTKWNFLKYKPGLVGGHCIGVDPYYLVHKSTALGYNPQVILSGRRVNENMGVFVASKAVKMLIAKGAPVKGGRALILGFAFKENCPDIRNTRVIDIYNELQQYGMNVEVYDPWANKAEVKAEYNVELLPRINTVSYEIIIVAVAHEQFLSVDYQWYKDMGGLIFDTKSFIDRKLADARL